MTLRIFHDPHSYRLKSDFLVFLKGHCRRRGHRDGREDGWSQSATSCHHILRDWLEQQGAPEAEERLGDPTNQCGWKLSRTVSSDARQRKSNIWRWRVHCTGRTVGEWLVLLCHSKNITGSIPSGQGGGVRRSPASFHSPGSDVENTWLGLEGFEPTTYNQKHVGLKYWLNGGFVFS